MNWSEADLRDWQNLQGRIGGTEEFPASSTPKRSPIDRMNKWEKEYAETLQYRMMCGLIDWFAFEPMKLRLAGRTYYTPDFAVIIGGKLEYHEIKGHWRDDALVKFKVAAELYPFTFKAIRKKKVREGGGWEIIRQLTPAGQQSLPLAGGE